MQRAQVLVEQRKHPRARLRLPARIRWRGPLGMRLEFTETIDVSREGVLLHRDEDSLAILSRVWITVPFDANGSDPAQPETPARIVRVDPEPGGGYRVALQLQLPPRESRRPVKLERRASPRIPFSLPIFVRSAETPWPEESMTLDFSRSGARFETSHIYATGDAVLAKIPWGEWAEAGEIAGRVVRVETMEEQPPLTRANPDKMRLITCVAVQWTNQKMKSNGKTRKYRRAYGAEI